MKITFLGGTETVTGSKYLVETATTKLLIDCGLYQGYKWLRKRNREPLPLNINELDAIVLTHAHLDHSGFIPAIYKQGYRGPVYTHSATLGLCSILLPDSGHIQEDDAKFYSKHKLSKHETPEPLYDKQTAQDSLSIFETVDFEEEVIVGDITFYLQPIGHILGAASIILKANGKTIGFSGDVGRTNDLLMPPPKVLPKLDLLLLESTYGNREHSTDDPYDQVADIINTTVKKGGVTLIPSFAVGRTELIQHILATLIEQKRIPKLPIFLDSPMAINVFDFYCQYNELIELSKEDCHKMCNVASFVRTVDESKSLSEVAMPHIIIAGSGMVTGGRILHHLKRLVGDYRTTVLFTGYQSGGTRGGKMLSGVDTIKIHGKWFPMKANVEVVHGLSGHGDFKELTQWLLSSPLNKNTPIQLVHGDPEASETFRDYLSQHTGFDVSVASYKSIIKVE
ncbi:MBL fold metallo-hydrolase RNA specificity domain-containing protein [Pseudoalteromonas piratica]|uniref:mRNA 3'-end processing factor n=1 Tax=Pseudoalteromonas piratica TaxID=1348114 RepID=A0A0A7EHY4_9GAMM|nr:MBL fold metallo-hydrolase [Pseudoalteromonas piratica]AIY66128.1 mRNA 3'-end processing factor [Pseudoalteromonas piratica]